MRPIDLDFQRPRLAATPLGWTLFVTGLLLVVLVVFMQRQAAAETATRERALRLAERQLQGEHGVQAPLSASESREQESAMAEMRRVSAQMNLPWSELFATLEAIPQNDVALLMLAPDARKGQLRISAEARNLAAMLEFHKRLEQSAVLSEVSLLNHEIITQTAERPIRFNVMATWILNDAHP